MAYYKQKSKTGDEYVKTTKDFVDYTIFIASKMPVRMKDYVLTPMVDIASAIEDSVTKANSIYIESNKVCEQTLEALTDRLSLLSDSLNKFKAFDAKFDRLMNNIDLLESEFQRMSILINDIVSSQLSVNPRTAYIQIEVKNKINEIEYCTTDGRKSYRLMLTKKQKDYWLLLEARAIEEIKLRAKYDKDKILQLKKRLSAQ